MLAPTEAVLPTIHPQVAQYNFLSAQDASVLVEFGTDTSYGLRTSAQNTPPGGGAVDILVAGMKPFTTYHMRAVATFLDNSQFVDTDHSFTTGGLPPSRIPPLTVSNPHGLTPTPGAIFFHFWVGTDKQINAAAVDNDGSLIWYYDYDHALPPPTPFKLLDNGHILMVIGKFVREVDLAGNLISEFDSDTLNTWLAAAGYNFTVNSIHHDILPLPNGHLVLLVNHKKDFVDLPGFPGTTSVLGDAIIDLDQNHVPVWLWDSFDHLDVNRHLMGFPDWTHANALSYSPTDGNLIMSIRHQSWVIKVDYQNGAGAGDVLWRLGYQGDFTLTNGTNPDWFYAQHYEEFGWVTPTLPEDNEICAYAIREQNGLIKCAFEQAYNDGLIPWKKPISCHLYPITASKGKQWRL